VQRRRRAEAVVRRWGVDTLAPFALRRGKALFFFGENGEEVLVPYRVVGGIALVSGDPIGPPEQIEEALGSFLVFAHRRGWEVAVLEASERLLATYRSLGLRAVYHGDEAVLDTTQFSLGGGAMRAVRQAVNRLERLGFGVEARYEAELTEDLRGALVDVERRWLNGRRRTGFTMELDGLFRIVGEDALFVIGRAPDGTVAGFLHLVTCRPGRSLSLSSMPRLHSAPNGFNSWLIVNTVRWAAANGFEHLSLNFSPFARLLGGDPDLSVAARLEREALLALKGALSLQLDNLFNFNRQFAPRTVPRFVVYERRTELPLVATAAMIAEGYLPFPASEGVSP
jgi:lysyl-tRNA synthetase class 2